MGVSAFLLSISASVSCARALQKRGAQVGVVEALP
jgi:hypothetical protein